MMSLSANMLNLHFHIIAAAISDGVFSDSVFREKVLTILSRALDDLLFHDVILSKHLGHGNWERAVKSPKLPIIELMLFHFISDCSVSRFDLH